MGWRAPCCESDQGVRLERALKMWGNGSRMWRGSGGGAWCASWDGGVLECLIQVMMGKRWVKKKNSLRRRGGSRSGRSASTQGDGPPLGKRDSRGCILRHVSRFFKFLTTTSSVAYATIKKKNPQRLQAICRYSEDEPDL